MTQGTKSTTLVNFWVSDFPPGLKQKIRNILESKSTEGFECTIKHRKDAQLDTCCINSIMSEANFTSPRRRIDVILLGSLEIKQRQEQGGFWAFTNAKSLLDFRRYYPEHGIIFVGAFPLMDTSDCPSYDKDSNFYNLCMYHMIDGGGNRPLGWNFRFENPCNHLSDSDGYLAASLYEADGVTLTPSGLSLALTPIFLTVGHLDRTLRTSIPLHTEYITKARKRSKQSSF